MAQYSSFLLQCCLPVLLLCLLFFPYHAMGASAFCPPTYMPWMKRHVTITNDVTDSEGDGFAILIHCKSKDDDLGQQFLGSAEFHNSMDFKFKSNAYSTLFWCNAWWGNVIAEFHAYDAQRDDSLCKHCSWSIRNDGGYFYDQCEKEWQRLYTWRNGTASVHP